MQIKPTFIILGFVVILANVAHAEPLAGSSLAQITGSVTGNTIMSMGSTNSANTIDGGFDGAAGVSVVQQNNGDNNLITSAVSVADLSETVPAMTASSNAVVNTMVSGNTSSFNGSAVLSNVISGAFNGASGVMIIQQNNGHNNVLSSAVSVSGNGGLAALAQVP